MTLYEYYRSSASYRLRIGLNWKGIPAETVQIDLAGGGAQHTPEYRAVNPQGRVPCLKLDDGTVLIQSPAILEWLEETYPEKPMLPADPLARARARGLAALIACDIHPVNNSGVLAYLRAEFGAGQEAVTAWCHNWIRIGFTALEQMVDAAPYCIGDQPTLADIFLVPQVANARRFALPLEAFPKIVAIEQACLALPAFAAARPEAQPASTAA